MPHLRETGILAFHKDVAASKSYLQRYARQHLHNDAWADDAVAETMLAAIEKPENFHGKSSLNTWLVGILKFKIIDCLRAHSREIAASTSAFGNERDGDFADQYPSDPPLEVDMGHEFPNPETTFESYEFLAFVDHSLAQMPTNMRRVFFLGEWMGYSTEEICKELSITPANAWVLLHRARGRLRDSLRGSLGRDHVIAHC